MKILLFSALFAGCLMAQSSVNGSRTFDGTLGATSGILGTKITDTYTAGASGTTVNLTVAKDTSSPARAVTPASGGCGFGVALASVASGSPVAIQWAGIATLIADNTVTAGHIVVGGTTTPGRGKDSGFTSRSSIDSSTCVTGFANSSASTGGTFTVLLSGAGDYGTQTNTIDGVTVTGTPTAGQVPTAISGTAATWQTVSGGGSSRLVKAVGYSNFLTNTSNTDQTHNTTTLPALTAGACYLFTGSVGNDSGTAVMTFKLKIGTTMAMTLHSTASGDSDSKVFQYMMCNDVGVQNTQHLNRMVTGVGGSAVTVVGSENFASTVTALITVNGGGSSQNARLQFMVIEVIN